MADAILSDAEASGIYHIRNLVNGNVYIGSTTCFHKRWVAHRSILRRGRHHSVMLQRAWDKYGEINFAFERLRVCPVAELIGVEQTFLDEVRPKYNVSRIAGSCLGVRHSPESNSRKGRPVGVPITASHREAISKSLLGNSNALGCVRSEETKLRMSSAFKGKALSAEHCAKLSAAKKGKKYSPERCAAISKAMKGRGHPQAILAKYTIANRAGEKLSGIPMDLRSITGMSPAGMSRLLSGAQKRANGWMLEQAC